MEEKSIPSFSKLPIRHWKWWYGVVGFVLCMTIQFLLPVLKIMNV